MNLLQRRVEMPIVVWKDPALTCDEKVLLAIVHSLDEGKGIVFTPADVAETLHTRKAAAVNLVRMLAAKGDLVGGKPVGRGRRMGLGGRLAEAIDQERQVHKFSLKMCFIQCLCGYDLRMDHVDQLRVCPECLRVVYYTPGEKGRMSR